ncbi:hypothetical protein PIB30_042907, partial [Stylosanthes scabra]|nr:hypothetical protein [Stylosanthes scabra]
MSLITVTTFSTCSAGTSTPSSHDHHRQRALLRHDLPCFRHKSPEIALSPFETAAAAVIDLPAVAAVCMWSPEFLVVDRASCNGFGAKWIGYGAVVVWSAAVEPELMVLGANDFGAYVWSIGNE